MQRLEEKYFVPLRQSLPNNFFHLLTPDEKSLAQAYPLLNMICKDREAVAHLREQFNILPPKPLSKKEIIQQAEKVCDKLIDLETSCQQNILFMYRLPIIMGEFPVHTRAINNAIKKFNQFVEDYYQNDDRIDSQLLNAAYKNILIEIRQHGSQCDSDSLWQLLSMMVGWSTEPTANIFKEYPFLLYSPSSLAQENKEEKVQAVETQEQLFKLVVADSTLPNKIASLNNPFISDYNFNFNRAGQLTETDTLLSNMFGLKIFGHVDAQVKYPPRFIPLAELHSIIYRQLSHRMDVPQDEIFNSWIDHSLSSLGVEFIAQSDENVSDKFVNPFLSEPISFLNPEKIHHVLQKTLIPYQSELHQINTVQLKIISHYLFELLQGFQINPGLALGIGANWDGTVNLSNEGGAYSFKFNEAEAAWGKRFKELSLHRQGPAEAYMNAGKGIPYEAGGLLTGFDYMTQLKPSEHHELIYNALVDNLIAELFPEPGYFENQQYKKYRKEHIVCKTKEGDTIIESFYQISDNGTYFKDKNGVFKQTPMYRRAGTLEVSAFPRDSGYSENSRASYAGNPLAPLQVQYAQSMHGNTRGHYAYDPINKDQFIPDTFYGQVMLSENGDYLPFNGIVPKNFDKNLKQENELCASFVIRMVQSSRIREYCPTFNETLDKIKTRFLPSYERKIPSLSDHNLTSHVKSKYMQLDQMLQQNNRKFADCQKLFYSLFKNLIYSLSVYTHHDQHLKSSFIQLITSAETFHPLGRANCERIIRELIISRPITIAPVMLKKYDDMIDYLKDLITYFYPTPSDSVAKLIALHARKNVKPLLETKSIADYFVQMQKSQQANLSRRQTPGMVYSALKYGGVSKAVVEDYKKMHGDNFKSGYRDPEGNQMGEPQTHERVLDWLAKSLGAGLQLAQRYNLFAVIRRPLVQPYIQVKEMSHAHKSVGYLALAMEGVKGFVWDGLLIGAWQTVTTPFLMCGDLVSWAALTVAPKKMQENALILSAASTNEPGLKVKASMQSRDYILQLINQFQHTNDRPALYNVKNNYLLEASRLLKILYPDLLSHEIDCCLDRMEKDFPLTHEEWGQLLKPFTEVLRHPDLLKFSSAINYDFIHAVFKYLSDPLNQLNSKIALKQIQSFYRLNSAQTKALTVFVNFYSKIINPIKKQQFIKLFQFGGAIQQILQVKDKQLHKIQNWLMIVFNEQWLRVILFEQNFKTSHKPMTAKVLDQIIDHLPDKIKRPLYDLCHSHNQNNLDKYVLDDHHKVFIKECYAVINTIIDANQINNLIQRCKIMITVNPSALSIKDKANAKWKHFAERELKHAPLSTIAVNEIIDDLSSKLTALPKLSMKLQQLRRDYQKIISDHLQSDPIHNSIHIRSVDAFGEEKTNDPLTQFYNSATELYLQLIKVTTDHQEASSLLRNFIDVTMNALVNARLDKVNIFSNDARTNINPLLNSVAIEEWLNAVRNNNSDLRALLEQQVQQSPSLDHALWRQKCIFQILEKRHLGERVRKTGVQSLLRFWCQHKNNVTRSGKIYFDEKETQPRKSATIFNGSRTMEYAINRVNEKTPHNLRRIR
ncbi:MAG: hypothetical protein ABI597_06075 [Gammaproteobacteria bacterium]